MNRLRPQTSVFGGAAIGLVAGVAVYGAVTSGLVAASMSTKPLAKPAQVRVAEAPPAAPVRATGCLSREKLEKGVCIIHLERVVVRAAPPALGAQATQAQAVVVALPLAPLQTRFQSRSRVRAVARTQGPSVPRSRTTRPSPPPPSVPSPPSNPPEEIPTSPNGSDESSQQAEQAQEAAKNAAEQAREAAKNAAEQASGGHD